MQDDKIARRVVDVRVKQSGAPAWTKSASGRILLRAGTANAVRQLARYEGGTLDELVQRMLTLYLREVRTELEPVTDEEES